MKTKFTKIDGTVTGRSIFSFGLVHAGSPGDSHWEATIGEFGVTATGRTQQEAVLNLQSALADFITHLDPTKLEHNLPLKRLVTGMKVSIGNEPPPDYPV